MCYIHRLLIAFHINFKMAPLAYKAIHLKQPRSLAKQLEIKFTQSTLDND